MSEIPNLAPEFLPTPKPQTRVLIGGAPSTRYGEALAIFRVLRELRPEAAW